MKKSVSVLIVCVFLTGFLFAPFVSADFESSTGLKNTGTAAGYTGTAASARTPAEIVGLVIQILLSFVGVIFLGLIIYSGYTWMLARGNEAEAEKAKKMIESAVIGLVIVLAAYAITYFVSSTLVYGTTTAVGPD